MLTGETHSPLGLVPSGWRSARLKEITTKIGSGATPRGGESVYLPSRERFALVRSQNVFDHFFSTAGLAFISEEQAEELSKVQVQQDDVLLNITGDGVTFARCCLAPSSLLPACVNQHVAIIRLDRKRASPRYVAAYLTLPAIKMYMESFNAGGSRRAITKGHIESFEVPLPPLEEQETIGSMFAALDEKIELNRRMNETLEAAAKALFKSWFVDFDPVRAKAEGRQPAGMSHATAAHFPNRFSRSAAGDSIPLGWESTQLENVVTVLETGGRPKGGVSGYTEGVPSIGAQSIVGLGKFDFSQLKFVPRGFFRQMTKGHIQSRDVFLYKDGGRPGEFEPHVALFGDGFPFDEASINEHVYRLRANGRYSQNLLYFWLSSEACMEEMRRKGTGVAIPGLNSTAVRSLAVLIPAKEVVAAFDQACDPLVSLVLNNANESRTLAALRDTLLPKLLSGEVRLRDTEQTVGACV